MIKISIIHPSRNRPKEADKTIKHWLGNAKDKSQIEYILSCDKSDKDLARYKALGIENEVYVSVHNNKSAIEAINRSAKVSTGNILLVVSDDFECFLNWDEALLKELEGKEDFIVKTQDGIQPTIITLPLMDRAYYNRFGYIYFGGYNHLFCDTEMTAVGHLLGKVITSDLVFEHIHYTTGKTRKDMINLKNDATWKQGEKLYNERLKTNFGIENPVMNYSDIKWR